MPLIDEVDELLGGAAKKVVELRPAPQAPAVLAPAPIEAPPQWVKCRPWIEAALDGDALKIGDVEQMLKDGKAQFWPGQSAAVVTEIVTYQNGLKVYQTVAAGGDLDEIERMIPGIEAFGRMAGCKMARIEGRRGWERRMKAFGYKAHSIIVTKEL